MISGQKQISPCPNGEQAATVERMVLTRSSRIRRQSLRNSFGGSCCLSSRETISDESLPKNAPLQWLQNTNDLGASTPPVPRRLTNHYSIFSSGAENTQIGRAALRTPGSHNQPAQSPVQ